jgi:hypothetical protein
MSRFESVNFWNATNVYCDGKVCSRTIPISDGNTQTLGLLLPGEYTFNTGTPELIEITSGRVYNCLTGEDSCDRKPSPIPMGCPRRRMDFGRWEAALPCCYLREYRVTICVLKGVPRTRLYLRPMPCD